jgi:hypothetical protein
MGITRALFLITPPVNRLNSWGHETLNPSVLEVSSKWLTFG